MENNCERIQLDSQKRNKMVQNGKHPLFQDKNNRVDKLLKMNMKR